MMGGGGGAWQRGVVKENVLDEEVQDTKTVCPLFHNQTHPIQTEHFLNHLQASAAFGDYLYIDHDTEWLLLHYIEGVSTKDIDPAAGCEETYAQAKIAAVAWEQALFDNVGFIQGDRSTNNVSDTSASPTNYQLPSSKFRILTSV